MSFFEFPENTSGYWTCTFASVCLAERISARQLKASAMGSPVVGRGIVFVPLGQGMELATFLIMALAVCTPP